MDEDYDYGFWYDDSPERKEEENVYFNIYNFFKIQTYAEDSSMILSYGVVGKAYS